MHGFVNLGDLRDPATPGSDPAVIDCRDWERPNLLSHAALDAAVDACARGLAARGLARGDRVAILSFNRAEVLIAYFAIMRAGLVAVPANFKFPRETIAFLLQDSSARLVFCDAQCRGLVPAGIPVVDFDSEAADGFARFLDPGPFETVRPEPGEAAMVLYTSGSTGRPKGVPLSHDGQLWAVRLRAPAVAHGPHRVLVAAPLFHMNALGTIKFVVAAGACVVLLPQFDARRFVEAIGRFKVTRITSVPTMLTLALRERETIARTDLTSVEIVTAGSAPMTQAQVDEIRAAFPKASFSLGYGTTESGPAAFGSLTGHAKPDLSLGWPMPGVEVRLVTPEGTEAEEGELWIRTPANMSGYLNLPEKTASVLTVDGWYKTGDVFRRDPAGHFTFVGRTDDMFVCGGENIYPGDVEGMLERHPDIVQACVVAVPDDIKGAKPFAFVVHKPGAALSEDDVKRYALANAPAYQHPRGVVFMAELPLATTNKVDRKTLAEVARERWCGARESEARESEALKN